MSVKFETNIPVTLYFPFGDAKEAEGNYGTQYAYTVKHGDSDAGQKDQLFATERLHQQLQGAAGLCPGGTLRGYAVIITKKEAGTKKYFDLCWIDGTPVEPLEEAPAPVPAPAAAVPPTARRAPASAAGPPVPPVAPARPAAPPPGAPAPAVRPPVASPPPPATHRSLESTVTVAGLGSLMSDCIRQAMKAWADAGFETDLPPGDTLHACAATLFIQACKEGLQHRQGHRQPAAESGAPPEPADQWGPPPPEDPNSDLPFR